MHHQHPRLPSCASLHQGWLLALPKKLSFLPQAASHAQMPATFSTYPCLPCQSKTFAAVGRGHATHPLHHALRAPGRASSRCHMRTPAWDPTHLVRQPQPRRAHSTAATLRISLPTRSRSHSAQNSPQPNRRTRDSLALHGSPRLAVRRPPPAQHPPTQPQAAQRSISLRLSNSPNARLRQLRLPQHPRAQAPHLCAMPS